jgi:predicted PurR-regulated permease PerM
MLFLFFASLGGLASFGLLGLFLGPILLAVLLELFRIYREEFQDQPSEILVK